MRCIVILALVVLAGCGPQSQWLWPAPKQHDSRTSVMQVIDCYDTDIVRFEKMYQDKTIDEDPWPRFTSPPTADIGKNSSGYYIIRQSSSDTDRMKRCYMRDADAKKLSEMYNNIGNGEKLGQVMIRFRVVLEGDVQFIDGHLVAKK